MNEARSERITPIGTTKEGVAAIPKEYVHFDPEFPSVSIKDFTNEDGKNFPSLAQAFAKQYVDGRATDGIAIATTEVTKFLGRASLSEPGMVLSTADGKRTFASIKTKPTGVAKTVRESWSDYQGKDEAFFYHKPTQPHGDIRTDLVKRDAMLGLGSHVKERQRKDAENSVLLHEIGVKTRLPISGWDLDAFMVWDDEGKELVARDAEWFKAQGNTDDELYQAAWGLSCPITLEDVNDFLLSAIDSEDDVNLEQLRGFIEAIYMLAQKDISPEYKQLCKDIKVQMDNIENSSREELANFLKEFVMALAKTSGRNYQQMYQNDLGKQYTHGVLHDQNISFFGEFCDNFTVKEGLLEIGVAPENSADMSGLISALRQLSMFILILKGEKRDIDLSFKGDQYSDAEFFPIIRKSWPSYEKCCIDIHQAEIDRFMEVSKGYIESKLDFMGEDITNENIREFAEKKIGRIYWPFGEPS